LHKKIRFAPELSWLSCVRIAKRFVSTLRAIGAGPSCLITCVHAFMRPWQLRDLFLRPRQSWSQLLASCSARVMMLKS